MSKIPDLKLLTSIQLKEIVDACDFFLGFELGLPDAAKKTSGVVLIKSLNISFPNPTSFSTAIEEVAGQKGNIKEAHGVLYKIYELKLKEELSTRVEKTTPAQEQIETFEKEAESKKQEALESKEKAGKKQEDWLRLVKEQKIETPIKEGQEKVLQELKGKVVYVVPDKPAEEIKLTQKEEALSSLAVKNPRLFEQKLAEDIVRKNPDIFSSEELKPLADIVASDTTQALINPPQKTIPTGVYSALSDFKESAEIQKSAGVFTLISASKEDLYREILNRTVGLNLTNKILGFPETTYTISQTPPTQADGSFVVKLDSFQENSFSLQESYLATVFNNPVLDEAKSTVLSQFKDAALQKIAALPKESFSGKISRFFTSKSFDSMAPFLGLPTQMTYTGTTFFGKMLTTLVPQYTPLLTNVAAKLGIDVGINALAPVAGKAIETGVVAAGGAVAKTGLSATLSTAFSALGSWAPIVGNIVGWMVGWVAGKVIQPILNWIKKHQEDLKILGLLMLGGGALMQSIPLLVFGGLIFIPTAIRTGFSLAAIGARTAFLFGRIGASMAITIATPIIVMIIVFPILVAIILFIINSGAYVVPPKIGSGIIRAGCSVESAKIAGRAKVINNNLRLGFNNYYNNSPDYPELWNSSLYSQNPNPINQQSVIGATDMFWCNYMATKSFLEAGIKIPFPLSTMVEYFQKQPGKWVDGSTATPDSVCPGDTVYFKIPANSSGLAHVAIVYNVSSDGVTTVESNTPYKTMFYPVDESGHFQIIGSGNGTIKIVGFGTP